MKIEQANIFKHDMQLKAPWAIAGRVMESVENIFIELTTEKGIIGLGSGAPSPEWQESLLKSLMKQLSISLRT